MNLEAIQRALSEPPDFEWVLPIRTVNELNARPGHWAMTRKRTSAERATSTMAARAHFRPMRKPQVVRFTRLSAGVLDDDGLRAALKGTRDGVADAVGCDDSVRAGIEWLYTQEPCERGHYAVKVAVWV